MLSGLDNINFSKKKNKEIDAGSNMAFIIDKVITNINKEKKCTKDTKMPYSEFINFSQNQEYFAKYFGLEFFDFKKKIPENHVDLAEQTDYQIENSLVVLKNEVTKQRFLLVNDFSKLEIDKLADVSYDFIAVASRHSTDYFLNASDEVNKIVDEENGPHDFMIELYKKAKIEKASDIILSQRGANLVVRLRTSSGIKKVANLNKKAGEIIRSYLEVKSSKEVGQMFYDGQMIEGGEEYRINFFITDIGYRVTIRVYNSDFVGFRTLKSLGYTRDVQDIISSISRSQNGIFVFTAPTGQGKTTTQNVVLDSLSRKNIEVLSVEQPIERNLEEVDQVDTSTYVNADDDNKITTRTILKNFLRARPDIINAGELRDREDYDIAKEIALTGHLLFASTHVTSVVTTINRFKQNGIQEDDLKTLLRGIVYQQLTRQLCPNCRIKTESCRIETQDEGIHYKSSQKGCPDCKYGYLTTETPIVEIAEFHTFKDYDLHDTGTYKNYVSLLKNAEDKYNAGIIDNIHFECIINGERKPSIYSIIEKKYLDKEDLAMLKIEEGENG